MKKLLLLSLTFWGGGIYTNVNAQTDPNMLPAIGNVGIGTETPMTKLEVMGTVHIDSTLKVSDSLSVTGNTKLGQDLKVEGNLYLTNLPSFETSTGVLEPLYKSADGSVYKGPIVATQSAAIPCLTLPDGSLANVPFWISNVATASLYTGFCSNSKVGIGTDSPRVSFDNRGITYSNRLALGSADPLALESFFHLKAGLGAQKLILVENSTRKLLQLDNSGLLYAREIKVDLVAWPDYVFEENYDLMPLSILEAFINKNKHLPNVPNANTVETEGLNLAEINKIMMEKIEELTLYIIEQDKRIKALETITK